MANLTALFAMVKVHHLGFGECSNLVFSQIVSCWKWLAGMMVQDMLLHTDFVSVAGYWLMLDWQEMPGDESLDPT